jgi:hypothetical protein
MISDGGIKTLVDNLLKLNRRYRSLLQSVDDLSCRVKALEKQAKRQKK